MSDMLSARLHHTNDLRLERLPIPTPGPDQVVCRVAYCGICGTDHAIYSGNTSFIERGWIHYPMTLGHEWSGSIVAAGSSVHNVVIGDRVAGDTCVACGQCYHCLVGNYARCKKMQPVGTVFAWDGAYAEYILMPSRHVIKLPDNVTFEQGALMEPAATALYSVKCAQVKIGETVLVLGTGAIGLLAVAQAKLSGAAKVVSVGRQESKLALARELGADDTINTTAGDWMAAVRRLAPNGPDCIIEASGSHQLLADSLLLVRQGGIIAAVAFYERDLSGFNADALVLNDITLRGVGGSAGCNLPVLNLIASGQLHPEKIITSRCTLNGVVAALDTLKSTPGAVKIMMQINPEA